MITKKYYKLVKVSYEDEQYFYLKNTSDQVGNFVVGHTNSAPNSWTDVEYSLDGANWISYDLTTLPTVQVQPQSNIYLRGNGAFGDWGTNWHWYINMDVDHDAFGNVFSLIDKTNFKTRTTNVNYAVVGLFKGDTHLIHADGINFGQVATLNKCCYGAMFKGCSSLVSVPELPIATLAEQCYTEMFSQCYSLKNITCLATDISASSCTSGWVYGVGNNGTFVKSANMSNWASGQDGIPSNWTVVNA